MDDDLPRPHVKARYLFVAALVGMVIGWAITTAWRGGDDAFRRSGPGFLIRNTWGESGLQQDVNDLTDELGRPETAAALRSWATAVLTAQHGKEFSTDGAWKWGDLRAVPAPYIAPPLSVAQFHAVVGGYSARGVSPVYYSLLDSSDRAVGVALSWANFRFVVLVVPGGQAPELTDVYYQQRPAPDIAVFAQ